jgi:hypothetical protein
MKNVFKELIGKLAENDVRFVICGGVAAFLHGIERATYDLDISISMETKNIEKLIKSAKDLGLYPRIPEPIENILSAEKRKEWIEKKDAVVYTLISGDSLKQIDILLNYYKTFDQLNENAIKMNIYGHDVLVSSIDDLIDAKLKIKPLREKDETDINELKKLKNGRKERK